MICYNSGGQDEADADASLSSKSKKPQSIARPTSRNNLSRQSSGNSQVSTSPSAASNHPMQPKLGHMATRVKTSRNRRGTTHSNLSLITRSLPPYSQLFTQIFRPESDVYLVEAPPSLVRPEDEMPYGAMLTNTIKLGSNAAAADATRNGIEKSESLFSPRGHLRGIPGESLFSPKGHLRGQVISAASVSGAKSLTTSPNSFLGGRRSPSQMLPWTHGFGDDSFILPRSSTSTRQSAFIDQAELRTVSSANHTRVKSDVRRFETIEETVSHELSPSKSGRRAWSSRPRIDPSALKRSQPFTLTSSRQHDPLPPPPPSLFTAISPGARHKAASLRSGEKAFGGGFHAPSPSLSPSSLPHHNVKGPDPSILLQELMSRIEIEEGDNRPSFENSGSLELFHRPKSWAAELPTYPSYPQVGNTRFKASVRPSSPSGSSPFLKNMSKELQSAPPRAQSPLTNMTSKNSNDKDPVFSALVRPLSPSLINFPHLK